MVFFSSLLLNIMILSSAEVTMAEGGKRVTVRKTDGSLSMIMLDMRGLPQELKWNYLSASFEVLRDNASHGVTGDEEGCACNSRL